MKIVLRIILLILYVLIHNNAWLPPADKDLNLKSLTIKEKEIQNKILSPLIKSLETIDNLSSQIKSFFSETNKLKSIVNKIDVSPLQNIKNIEIKLNINKELEKIIVSTSLEPKKDYLIKLEKFKSKLDINQYKKLIDTFNQTYLYKKLFNDISNNFSKYKNKIIIIKQEVRSSIEESENNLKETQSAQKIELKTIQKYEADFNELKFEILKKVELLNKYKNMLNIKTGILNNIQNELILKINKISVVISTNIKKDKEIVKIFSEYMVNEAEKVARLQMISYRKEFQKGIEFFKHNNIKKAKEFFQKKISNNPNNWYAKSYMSKIYIKEKKYNLAVIEINEALKIFKKKLILNNKKLDL